MICSPLLQLGYVVRYIFISLPKLVTFLINIDHANLTVNSLQLVTLIIDMIIFKAVLELERLQHSTGLVALVTCIR